MIHELRPGDSGAIDGIVIPMFDALFGTPRLENAPRSKKWVDTLLRHRPALERAADGKLGEILGCGHWGCVVDMVDSPYVLKLTIDPTEAPVWLKLSELIRENGSGEGFPEIHRVFELRPGLPYYGKLRIPHGIVREKVAPVLDGSGRVTVRTLTELGLQWEFEAPPGFTYTALGHLDYSSLPNATQVMGDIRDFIRTLDALRAYRDAAHDWHAASHPDGRERAEVKLWRAIDFMEGWVGYQVGDSLRMLTESGLILRDTHLGNIGWRVMGEDFGPRGLVIFDPGHTPTEPREFPVEHWQQYADLC